MGYETYYSLATYPESHFDKVAEVFEEIVGYDPFCGERYKWYEHTVDSLKVSAMLKTTAFRISGSGEEDGDIWWEEYLGGEIIDSWRLSLPEMNKVSEKTQVLAEKTISNFVEPVKISGVPAQDEKGDFAFIEFNLGEKGIFVIKPVGGGFRFVLGTAPKQWEFHENAFHFIFDDGQTFVLTMPDTKS